ncbi:MAG: decarboxylating NADP(+)-dependent phosphogluconate dehydrogenase [Oscillospiraceae bacterium]|nr:decarboxylating NADP(+)-dependent phosphogluconate dehydrogenase [Oscillospiraceae bacterium]
MDKCDIGLIGLAVMGENLALNMESKGFSVCVYNRTAERTRAFIEGRAAGKNIIAAQTLEELTANLQQPRKVMLMIKAGEPVDETLEALVPLLKEGDVIIDGGNSHYGQTIQRTLIAESKGLLYIGAGISGGEEGALKGPSIMPGGSAKAWPIVEPILTAIAAKADDGEPCCSWVGSGGAGHFVKMVHNGIEYGDMQIICEVYHMLRNSFIMDADEMSQVFARWNAGPLSSYLLHITAAILSHKTGTGGATIDLIQDTAGQKGTGMWASVSALGEGVPLTLISEAVYARHLSAMKEERVNASWILEGPEPGGFLEYYPEVEPTFMMDLRDALYAARVVSYAQGFALMKAASESHGWNLDLGKIAKLWRAGCIIRSSFLDNIKSAYGANPNLDNLLLDDFFKTSICEAQEGLRRTVATAVMEGIPIPALSSALSYYDGYRTSRLPANLLQAMRDYFGAHTYERVDRPRGEMYHTDW